MIVKPYIFYFFSPRSILIIFLFSFFSLQAEIRAVWVPIWELDSSEKIDSLLADVSSHKINQIMAQIRYRGDAMYIPNRIDSTYSNPDTRCYILSDSTDFDPLGYLIHKSEQYKIEIHGWVTSVIISPHGLEKLASGHFYFLHPEWITADFSHTKMPNDVLEGAYLDPGIPDVREYITNVILDIVSNYDLAGIHLDYIRYPDRKYGYNEFARTKYSQEIQFKDADSWSSWKQAQLTKLVRKIYKEIKIISPEIVLSAAVISDPEYASEYYSQNWVEWLDSNIIDQVYLMAYDTSYSSLVRKLERLKKYKRKNIIVGLRAWTETEYPVSQINNKIKLVRALKFGGFGLYSYSGIRQQKYFKGLKY